MREEFKNINEMSDSRELLESKPNPIMPLFIYLLITIIVITGIWTYFGEIDEVIKASGVIRPDEAISTVRNEMASQVEDIYFEEGKLVKQGDILFTLKQSDQQLQQSLLEDRLNQATDQVSHLKVLKESIREEEDLFTEESKQGQAYERYKAFQTNLALMEQEHEGSTLEVSRALDDQNLQNQQWQRQKTNLEKKIDQLEKLKEAIEKQKNLFTKEEAPYYNRFIDIQLTVDQMENAIKEAEKYYESIKSHQVPDEESEEDALVTPETTDPKDQIDNAEQLVTESKLKLEQYMNQQLLQINSEIEQEKNQLNELKHTLSMTKDYTEVVDYNRENYLATVENFKSDVLLQVNADIESMEQQVEQLEKELILLEDQMKSYIVTAPIDGKVNIRTNISKGDYLQAGTEVLTIVPQTKESTFTVQLSILNQDIANTAVGDQVKLRIHSLPYQEYGQLEGEITRISTDAINDPETGLSYYLAEAVIDQDELVSYKGVPGHIKVGMTTDAHIVSESKKILHFLLEKIDLRD